MRSPLASSSVISTAAGIASALPGRPHVGAPLAARVHEAEREGAHAVEHRHGGRARCAARHPPRARRGARRGRRRSDRRRAAARRARCRSRPPPERVSETPGTGFAPEVDDGGHRRLRRRRRCSSRVRLSTAPRSRSTRPDEERHVAPLARFVGERRAALQQHREPAIRERGDHREDRERDQQLDQRESRKPGSESTYCAT